MRALRLNIKIELDHVVGWQSRSFFLIMFVAIWAKNMALSSLVQNIVGRKKVVKLRFRLFQVPKTTKLEPYVYYIQIYIHSTIEIIKLRWAILGR